MIGVLVLSNLMYLVGAVVAIVVLSLLIVARHRRPKSVEANVKTFHRGLAALAPESSRQSAATSPVGTVTPRSQLGAVRRVGAGETATRGSEADTG
jgi:hypothetical protein